MFSFVKFVFLFRGRWRGYRFYCKMGSFVLGFVLYFCFYLQRKYVRGRFGYLADLGRLVSYWGSCWLYCGVVQRGYRCYVGGIVELGGYVRLEIFYGVVGFGWFVRCFIVEWLQEGIRDQVEVVGVVVLDTQKFCFLFSGENIFIYSVIYLLFVIILFFRNVCGYVVQVIRTLALLFFSFFKYLRRLSSDIFRVFEFCRYFVSEFLGRGGGFFGIVYGYERVQRLQLIFVSIYKEQSLKCLLQSFCDVLVWVFMFILLYRQGN